MLFNKEKIITAAFFIFCAAILMLTVKGLPGNPAAEELNLPKWTDNGPFTTSNDRGRYALIYSVVENRSLILSKPLAIFSSPDLAINNNGQYVSLFAPGVPFIMIPSYLAGRYFGMAQLAVFITMAFFALLNIVLLRAIAIRLGANPIEASLGALTFIFATPAFAYATTLYQHHISTFIILLGFYILIRWNNWLSLALIWFLFALSGAVDNPNYFIMAPIALAALGRIIIVSREEKNIKFNFRLAGALALLVAIIPIGFFFWFNKNANGGAMTLSGSLERVTTIQKSEDINQSADLEKKLVAAGANDKTSEDKNPVSFFKTRNILNGFYIHSISPDRGITHYTPIVLLGIYGIYFLYKKNKYAANILTAIIGMTVLTYSMWGDPYGGWSFGSRYLIPVYALLSLGVAFAVSRMKKNYIFLLIFIALFVYSARINALGAITTSANPPQVEILALEKITGMVQSYTEDRNWQFLREKGSRSFVYNQLLKNKLSAEKYYWVIFSSIVAALIALIAAQYFAVRGSGTKNENN